jgi:glycosidase
MRKTAWYSTLLFIIGLFIFQSASAKNTITRIDPAFWWVGMQNPTLELLIYHPGISKGAVRILYSGVTIEKAEPAESPDYLYLTLNIDKNTKPGICPIDIRLGDKIFTYDYELRLRNSKKKAEGVNTSDFIYLIMPDRFSNGDTKNDVITGMNETALNRDSMYYRHGGDIQGIMNHLDYLQNIGSTSLWLNPVQENNEIKTSYHGYAITDHYKIDPRLGTNKLYCDLVDSMHARGMKMVMDIVPNHMGIHHWMFNNLPSKDYIHHWDTFTKTSYRAPSLLDPYASENDRKLFSDGWFDRHMPDLNQQNPHVAKYLTQSYIWWIEYAGVDDYRIDTYSYSDQEFMAQLSADLHLEYPNLNLFGEIWDHGVGVQSYFTKDFKSRNDFNTGLDGVVDFQVYFALIEALTKPFGWTEGVSRIYYTLAQDFLYQNPNNNVTFLDNHDLSRFASVVGGDIRKYKMGIAFLMTMRGIPSAYYGTEILMKGFSNPDGLVRSDFSGGWPKDSQNKFNKQGRNEEENVTFDFFQKLANWRKENPVLHSGKLMQFVPEESVYTYFRYDGKKTVMVVMNANDSEKNINTERFAERIQGKSNAFDVIENKSISLGNLQLKAWEVKILEF